MKFSNSHTRFLKLFLLFLMPVLCSAQAYVSTFGAKGDGVTNDAEALQAALKSGSKTVYLDAGKTYITDKPLVISAHTTLIGNGAVLKPGALFPANRTGVLLTPKRVAHKADDVMIAITTGETTFTYTDAAKLNVGQLLELNGGTYATFGSKEAPYRNGWYGVIRAIDGETVTLATPASATFTATSLKAYSATTDVHITDVAIDLRGRETGYGIGLINVVDGSIEGCTIQSDSAEKKSAEMGIYALGVNLKILNNTIRKIRIARSGAGYGINVQGHSILVQGNTITTARHGITSAGRDFFSTDLIIRGNTVSSAGGYAPIDFHGNASGLIDSNFIYSVMPNIYGIAIRNNNTTVKDNYIEMQGQKVTAIKAFELAGANIDVQGNKIKLRGTGKAFHAAKPVQNLKVANNALEKSN